MGNRRMTPRTRATTNPMSRADRAHARRIRVAREVLKSLHQDSRGIRSELLYQDCIRLVPDAGAAIREAEEELADAFQKATRMQEALLAKLRAERRRASPLMIDMCRAAGLDPGTVAAGVMPFPLRSHPSDGHPWLTTGSDQHAQLVGHINPAPATSYRNETTVRSYRDDRGALTVRQERGTLEVWAILGGACVQTRAGKATIRLDATVPDTMLAAMVGRPIGALVEHPVLADPSYVVLSTKPTLCGTQLTFACPNTPFGPLGDGDCGRPPLLHSDPSLAEYAATLDIVQRARMVRGRGIVSPVVELLHAQARIRGINLTRTFEHRLPQPTPEMIAWVNGRRTREVI